MINKLLKQALVMSRYAFIGLIIQMSLANILLASGPGSAQNKKLEEVIVSLNFRNATFEEVFEEIERNTEFSFAFDKKQSYMYKRYSKKFNEISLRDVLSDVSKTAHLNFKRINDNILVSENKNKRIKKAIVVEKIEVSGIITDATNGEPLPGVSVLIKNTATGTVTDVEGKYVLQVNEDDVLVYSFIGYKRIEEAVNSRSVIDVGMETDLTQLDEVVVVGYGTQQKSHITGSVASVSNDKIKESATSNVTNALVGKVPGLYGVQQSGEPGADFTEFYIRGRNSLNNNSRPLVIVDGVQRPWENINPQDIESFTILKDAAAAAIYGVRAANGVILVTTKRGTDGKPTISYNFDYNTAQPTVLPEFANAYEFTTYWNEANVNDGDVPFFSDQDIENYRSSSDRDLYPDTDWLGNGLKTSQNSIKHNLGVSGGNDKVKYFLSAGYLNQDGLVHNVKYKRYNLRSNIDMQINDNLSVKLNLGTTIEDKNNPGFDPGSDIFGPFFTMWPIYKDKYSNGLWGRGRDGNNPIQRQFEGGYQNSDKNQFNGTFGFNYQLPIEGLSIGGDYSFDRYTREVKNWSTPITFYHLENGEYIEEESGRKELFRSSSSENVTLFETNLTYSRTINEHSFKLFALYTQRESNTSYFQAERKDHIGNIDQLNLGDVTTATNSDFEYIDVRQGLVGRMNYNYKERYLLEATVRYEGSQKFAKEQRMGTFPSVSVGWNLGNEAFMSNVEWLDQLKIRGSWGKAGFDNIEPYRYLSFYEQDPNGYYVFDDGFVSSVVNGALPDQSATWEKVTTKNLGLNVDLLQGKFSFEADVFNRLTTDILIEDKNGYPSTLGAELPYQNLGEMESYGYELALNHKNKVGPVDINLNVNFSRNNNKIKKLSEEVGLRPEWSRVGHPFGTRLMYKANGIFKDQQDVDDSPAQESGLRAEPGLIKYEDTNGDGVVNVDDKVLVDVNTNPRSIFGMSLGARYKGFSLDLTLQGAFDFKTYLSSTITKAFIDNATIQKWHIEERWTPENRNATYPRLSTKRGSYDTESTFWLKNASFIRLKSVQLQYNVPSAFTSKLGLSNLNFYLQGFNLLTFSDMKIVDPSAPSYGGAGYYPVMKNFAFGLNVSL